MVRDTSPVSLHGPWAPRTTDDACRDVEQDACQLPVPPAIPPVSPEDALTPKSGGTIASFFCVGYREMASMPAKVTDRKRRMRPALPSPFACANHGMPGCVTK